MRCLIPRRSAATTKGLLVAVTLLTVAAFANAQEWLHIYDASGNFIVRSAALAVSPQIIGQPVSRIVEPGEIASFSAVVRDASGVTFQWKFNGADIAGATGDSLLLTNVGALNVGRYSVVVSNSLGSIVSTAAALMLDSNGDGIPDNRIFIPVMPAPGMVAYWRGEADARDSVGTHHGTFYSGASVTPPSIAPGLIGNAFSFDGAVDVHLPYVADLEPAQITIEAWIYPTVADGNFQTIITRPRGVGEFPAWALGLRNGDLYFYTSQGPIGGYEHVPLNQWTHVAATSDGTNRAIYMNGVRLGQDGSGILKYDQPGPVTLGNSFAGRVDEISFYNRALTSNEVAAIATANSAGKDLTRPYFTSPFVFPLARVGLNYAQPITMLFGIAPVTFSLSAGSLPPGLILSSTGLLSGTPSAAGNFSFTLRATDATAVWNFTDQMFTVSVLQPLAPPAGLVASWRAENNAQDAAGTNHGTLINGAAFASGEVGQAFSLNGLNQSVEIPDAPALRPTSITLEAWVLFNSGDNNQAIFSKRLSAGDASYYLYFSSSLLIASAGDASPIYLGNFTPIVGRWYHLAYTFDNVTKQLTLYVDGVPRISEVVNQTIGYDTNPVSWGRYGTKYLNGRIDEAAIYNRALNASEVASIYNAGPAGKSPLSPMEQWKFDYLGDANAPDAGDPDGDGQSNLFEYVAGTIPTDAASRFALKISPVPDPSNPGQALTGQQNLIFSPRFADRAYAVTFMNELSAEPWLLMSGTTTTDDGQQRTVTDLNASASQKFYRVEITKP